MTEVFDQAVDSVMIMMEVMLMVDRYYVYIYMIVPWRWRRRGWSFCSDWSMSLSLLGFKTQNPSELTSTRLLFPSKTCQHVRWNPSKKITIFQCHCFRYCTLWLFNIAMENHKPSIDGPFSMAMLNNQMVYPYNFHSFLGPTLDLAPLTIPWHRRMMPRRRHRRPSTFSSWAPRWSNWKSTSPPMGIRWEGERLRFFACWAKLVSSLLNHGEVEVASGSHSVFAILWMGQKPMWWMIFDLKWKTNIQIYRLWWSAGLCRVL